MSELGSIYYYGEEGGVEKDIQKSFDWFMKAAEAGSKRTSNNRCVLSWWYGNRGRL